MTVRLGLEIEREQLTGVPLSGCNIDTIKCYDSQVRPAGFVDAQTRLYDDLKKLFLLGRLSVIGLWLRPVLYKDVPCLRLG